MSKKKTHCDTCGTERVFRIRMDKGREGQLQGRCPVCYLSYQRKQWALKSKYNRKKPPLENSRDTQLKSKYGLTSEDYTKMLISQNNCCYICKKAETAIKLGRIKYLAVDHDHITGEVRKLLCAGCNLALGMIKENFDVALNLAKYIQEFKGIL